MSERPLSFFHLGGGNSSLTVGEPQILKCICLLFPEHRHMTPFSDGREEERRRASVQQGKANGSAKQGTLCRSQEHTRPGQPEATRLPTSQPGCPHKRSPYPCTDPLFSHTYTRPRYFKQNTSNFLFLKLSCISTSIPSDPGKLQAEPTPRGAAGASTVSWWASAAGLWGFRPSSPLGCFISTCYHYFPVTAQAPMLFCV